MKLHNNTPDPAYDFTVPTSPWLWLMNLGLLLIVGATALPLLGVYGDTFRWIFTAGAIMALAGRAFAPNYRGTITRVRRLNRIEFWSCAAFAVGAFFIWFDRGSTDWLAFTLAGGALQIYSSVMQAVIMTKEIKARKKNKQK